MKNAITVVAHLKWTPKNQVPLKKSQIKNRKKCILEKTAMLLVTSPTEKPRPPALNCHVPGVKCVPDVNLLFINPSKFFEKKKILGFDDIHYMKDIKKRERGGGDC